MTEDEIIYLINLAKTALLEKRSFATVSKFILDNIAHESEYKQRNWIIKTDYKDKTTIAYSVDNKLLSLIFNGVSIVFIGYNPE